MIGGDRNHLIRCGQITNQQIGLENRFFSPLDCFTIQYFAQSYQMKRSVLYYLKRAAVKTKQSLGGTELICDVFHAGGLCAAVRGRLKSELCSHKRALVTHSAALWTERKGRYVTPFDFCFVNKWQRGEKLSSAVRGSHQTAPNMARKGRSGAAAYPPN